MAALVFFDAFRKAVGDKKHNLSADTFVVALTNSAPVAATDDTISDITQISNGNGYTAGSHTLGSVTFAQSGAVVKFDADDEVITASGGSIGPFRYVVLYNNTAINDELVCYWDLGSSQSISDGQSLNLNFDATNGIFRVI